MSDPTDPTAAGSEPTPGTDLEKKAAANVDVPAQEATAEAPKNTRLRGILIALLVVVGLGAAAAITFALLAPQGDPTDPSAQPTPTTDGTTTAPVAPEPEVPVGPDLCATSSLTATFGTASSAAGSTSVPIVFTNISEQNCTLEGYPAVGFIRGTNGTQIGAGATLSASVEVTAVDVAPGATASATLLISTTPVQDCNAVTADGIRVTLPRSEESFIIDTTDYQACENIDVELLSVTPVFPG